MKDITVHGIMFMLFLLYIVVGIYMFKTYYKTSPDGVWSYICCTTAFVSMYIGLRLGEWSMKKKIKKLGKDIDKFIIPMFKKEERHKGGKRLSSHN